MCIRIALFAFGVALFVVDCPAFGQKRLVFNCGLGRGQSFRDEAEFTTLGALIQKCDRIEVWRIVHPGEDEFDRDGPMLAPFKTVEVLKWGPPPGLIHPMESTPSAPAVPELDWNQPGRFVVAFIKGPRVAVCYGPYWREVFSRGKWSRWNGSANDFAELYHGTVDQLIAAIRKIQLGEEVIISAVKTSDSGGYYAHLRMPSARIWRLKASLEITSEAQTIRAPSFVGWGAADEAAIPQLTRQLSHADPCRRWHAIFDLLSMGKDAASAISELENRLADREPQLRLLAAQAIQRIEPENPLPLPAIIFELRHPQTEIRNWAADILQRHSRLLSATALPILTERFDREPWPYSGGFASLMGEVGSYAPADTRSDLVALFARKLRASTDSDYYFRYAAVRAIGQLGPDIGPAVTTLKSLARRCPNSADDAARLLIRRAPEGAIWIAGLIDKPPKRLDNIPRLLQMADNLDDVFPILLDYLRSEKSWTRLRAAHALRVIGGSEFHESIRLSIGDLRESVDRSIARFAREIWPGDQDPEPRPAADPPPDQSEQLRQQRFALLEEIMRPGIGLRDRIEAIHELTRQGPAAREIAPALWREMKNDDTATRAWLVRALWRIEGCVEAGMFRRDCRPALLAELRLMLRKQEKLDVQEAALVMVQRFGKDAVSLIPDVIRLLKSPELRMSAVDTLSGFRVSAKVALPQLLELTKVDERELQALAIIAVCRASQGSPEAMQLLKEWCESENDGLLQSFEQGDLNGPLATQLVQKAIDNQNLPIDRAIRLLQSCDPEAAMRLVWAEFNPMGWRVNQTRNQ